MIIFFGFCEGIFHTLNILLLAYLIKGCAFDVDYKKIISASFLLFFSLTMYELYDTTGITLFLNLFVQFFVFSIIVKMNRRDIIVYFLLTICIESFLTTIVEVIGIWGDVGDRFFNIADVLETIVVFCLLVTIAYAKSNYAKTKELKEINNFIHIYLVSGLLLSTFILLGIDLFGEHISVKLYIALITLAILSPIINILMYVFYIKKHVESVVYKSDLKAMEVALQLQEKHFNDMVSSYSDLKMFKHDVNSYLITIGKLVDEEMYDELHVLTNNLKQTVNANALICNNVYISASINQFLSVMEKQDIKFDFEYDVLEEVGIKSIHLCSLFYNIISNAIEATMQCDTNKSIKLSVFTKNSNLIIKIANSVNKSFNIEDVQIGKSSKEDKINHGLGLRSIQDIVEIYHGHISRDVKNNEFHTEIILFEAIKNIVN